MEIFTLDFPSEKQWTACLTGQRAKNLKTLLRNEELTAAFDALLDIPGLWNGMRLTTLHKMLAMKCDEVSNIPGKAFTAYNEIGNNMLSPSY